MTNSLKTTRKISKTKNKGALKKALKPTYKTRVKKFTVRDSGNVEWDAALKPAFQDESSNV